MNTDIFPSSPLVGNKAGHGKVAEDTMKSVFIRVS
jgi:hypothetical protein